ncbi:hypothetical protein Csa_001836 [Cucumis sativus]|nr:hypothetical protein Csa_001836 [Cucumis sativus]
MRISMNGRTGTISTTTALSTATTSAVFRNINYRSCSNCKTKRRHHGDTTIVMISQNSQVTISSTGTTNSRSPSVSSRRSEFPATFVPICLIIIIALFLLLAGSKTNTVIIHC